MLLDLMGCEQVLVLLAPPPLLALLVALVSSLEATLLFADAPNPLVPGTVI
jgi:hypothetical protein